jgi:hypothetical protein
MEHEEAMMDTIENAKNRAEYWKAEHAAANTEIERLVSDCMTLALRLFGEDPDTFAPETREVMDRWRPKCMKLLSGIPSDEEAMAVASAVKAWARNGA